jgi:hypothetical protein
MRIAALHQNAVTVANVRRPGAGTPWEDRGAAGTLRAFARTVIAGIFSPGKLLESIRRLDARTDTVPLVILYGLFWAISVVVHAWIILTRYKSDHTLEINVAAFWKEAGIFTAIVAAGFVVLIRVAAITLEKLTALDMRQKLPPSMYFNVIAYCLAPSLLAPLPMVGPVLALTWIVLLWILAARKRLHAAWAASIIGALMTGVTVVALAGAVYYVGGFAYGMAMGDSVTKIAPPSRGR